ncbi:hypothetical protein [Acidithiobacillus sp.]
MDIIIHGKIISTRGKKIVQTGLASMVAMLAGCSTYQATMMVGDMHHMPKTPLRSAVIQSLVKRGEDMNNPASVEMINSCPRTGVKNTTDHCAFYYNEKYTGPGSAYAYAAQVKGTPHAPTALHFVDEVSANLNWVAGAGLSTFMPLASPLGILGDVLVGSSNSKTHGQVALEDYNRQVQQFNEGNLFWVARYYPTQQWQDGLNQSSHLAITLDNGLHPATWASGTSGAHLYKIHYGWWIDFQDGMFDWAWMNGKPKSSPDVLPTRLTWIAQPWRGPQKPFYIVNKKKITYPFMALSTIEYRAQPGFDIPQWISAHSTQLADWMVIYHQGDKAVVWKNGQITNYPQPMMISKKKK